MITEAIIHPKIIYPSASFEEFMSVAGDSVEQFTKGNHIIDRLHDGSFYMKHYHQLLITLFHQVFSSSSSFALAGSMMDSRNHALREYLLEHAEEEKDHWTWIIQDLKNSGYSGPDPRELFPRKPAQAYLSFAMFVALKHPVSRLAMAYVLEDLSGKHGIKYGMRAAQILKLNRDQVSFTVRHGELDQGHSQDIIEVLGKADLTPYEWAHCCHTARMTVELYKDMYNYAEKITQ